MKLKFKNQDYQEQAANAVVNLFNGQTKGFRKELAGYKGFVAEEIFANKKIEIGEEGILQNLKVIQKEQGLPVSRELVGNNFTVEMETGTGKTYVYIKTMYEMYKRYGWSKFIIMVPSVAIREGVYKSFQITEDHFQEIYGQKIRFFIYDTKNLSNLNNIKHFADTSNIEVIIMNYQAFASRSAESRKINQRLDGLESQKPIDIIKRTKPIVIIDEPQKFGPTANQIIPQFNPLFILRYSATHKKGEEFNKVYRLDAIDSFNQKLVKKINVRGVEVVGGSGTNGYLYLERIEVSKDSYPTAFVELEIKTGSGNKKTVRKIKVGDNLYEISNGFEQYRGFVVREIDGRTDGVTFTNGVEINVGQAIGDVNEDHIRRIQIRETIQAHLEKERLMFPKGIKVLSLFFIDEVAKYRKYDEQGNQTLGDYAKIFEEEYSQAIAQKDLFDTVYNDYLEKHPVDKVHNGYFSIDKKGKSVDSTVKRGEEDSDDISAYDLIMKNKEKLLGFSEPTRFIFSHSALREGWDNPNVFQICTLRHTHADISRRQEIGRGLRICVNQKGDRMDYSTLEDEFFDYNTLTVIANESYDTFARSLQNEILSSLSNRPTQLEQDIFSEKIFTNEITGERITLTKSQSLDLIIHLKTNNLVDKDYKVTDELVEQIEKKKLSLPDEFKPIQPEIEKIIMSVHGTATYRATSNAKLEDINISNLAPNDNFSKKEFQELWCKIKTKTTYEVEFRSEELIKNSIEAINNQLEIAKILVRIDTGSQGDKLDRESQDFGLSKSKTQIARTVSIIGKIRYDLVGEVVKGARITRVTAGKILAGINKDKFKQFSENPEDFISKICKIILEQKATTLVNSVVYKKLDQTYSDDIFTINSFKGSLRENIDEVKKHIYDYVKTDSKIERQFAKDLETGEVSVYAKLPDGFKIPTPIGNYNPDWAIVFDAKDIKYVYFIAETKGTMNTLELKKSEELKIEYARKHFAALGNTDIKYDVLRSYQDLLQLVKE